MEIDATKVQCPEPVLAATMALLLNWHAAIQKLGEERNRRIDAEGQVAQLSVRLRELEAAATARKPNRKRI